MIKIVHKLRKQSEEDKRHILHICTFFGAVLLFFVWTLTLKGNFTNPDTSIQISQDIKPFSDLQSNVISGFKDNTATTEQDTDTSKDDGYNILTNNKSNTVENNYSNQ